eukprot:11231352-Karenia_brevis.AAC.1
MKIFRKILPRSHHDRWCDLAVLEHLGVLAPLNLVRFSRISLFVRLITKPVSGLLVALYMARLHKQSWVQALQKDFQFLTTFNIDFASSSSWTIAQWAIAFRNSSTPLLRQVHRAFLSLESSMHALPNHLMMPLHTRSTDDLVFACPFCPSSYPTKQQCRVHMS